MGGNVLYNVIDGEHIATEFSAMPGILSWMSQVLAGSEPQLPCGRSIPTFASVTSPDALDAMGSGSDGKQMMREILAKNNTMSRFGKPVVFPSMADDVRAKIMQD